MRMSQDTHTHILVIINYISGVIIKFLKAIGHAHEILYGYLKKSYI